MNFVLIVKHNANNEKMELKNNEKRIHYCNPAREALVSDIRTMCVWLEQSAIFSACIIVLFQTCQFMQRLMLTCQRNLDITFH